MAELDEVIEGYRPELQATPAAREATRFMLLHPPVPWMARPGLRPDRRRSRGPASRLGPPRASLRVHGAGLTAATRAGALSTSLVRWGMAGLRDASTA